VKKEEAILFIETWRESLVAPREEDGLWHDPADDLHTYFEATNARDWMDVGDVATEAYNIMFVDEEMGDVIVEDGSPITGIWKGAAAQAAHGVWVSIADALGMNASVLEAVFEDWYILYADKKVPPPITMKEFNKRYKAIYKDFEKDGLL
jgi:hypothetical protein